MSGTPISRVVSEIMQRPNTTNQLGWSTRRMARKSATTQLDDRPGAMELAVEQAEIKTEGWRRPSARPRALSNAHANQRNHRDSAVASPSSLAEGQASSAIACTEAGELPIATP